MGDFAKHLKLAKEKLEAVKSAYVNEQHTVVDDLATKVVEQLIEASASKNDEHFGNHQTKHEYSNKSFPSEVNKAMRKIWFAYGDLGYDGVNGKRAKAVMDNIKTVIEFFEQRFGAKIE